MQHNASFIVATEKPNYGRTIPSLTVASRLADALLGRSWCTCACGVFNRRLILHNRWGERPIGVVRANLWLDEMFLVCRSFAYPE
jgi:hypothetical protein